MSSETTENIEGTGKDIGLEEAKLVWDEYKYRHELCWRLIFQITTAVVAILIIPYIQAAITERVGLWILALPFLALILVIFSMSRLRRELEILAKIRKVHRVRQSRKHDITWGGSGHFTRDVMLYLIGLMVLCIVDMISLIYIWLPTR